MSENKQTGVSFMMLIAGRGKKDALLSSLSESGAQVVNTVYGRGSVKASWLESVFGLAAEEHKALIICLIADSKIKETLEMLTEKFHFNRPNTGVAFTIPVSGIDF